MKKGKIIIISGPSGSGKTTLYKKLLSSQRFRGKLVKSISATTRPKRFGEKHGRDYLFMSRKEFFDKKRSSHFLETQKVFDNYYGTPKKNVQALLKTGKNVLLCIDVKGARVVSQKYSDAVKIFIKVGSLGILKKRLKERGTETKTTLKLRLNIARRELLEEKKYRYVVVNNSLADAFREMTKIINAVIDCKT